VRSPADRSTAVVTHSAPSRPGRACPLSYRYGADALRRAPAIAAETLYVVGGLYGNPFALDAVEAMAAAEPSPATVVFNGDFHWFDIDPGVFARIENGVRRHIRLRGNVETELAAGPQPEADCGCNYPDWVGDAEVARSNRIIAQLKHTAEGDPAACRALGALAMHATARIGDCRIAIVHGDEGSLSGWGFSERALGDPAERARLEAAFEAAGADVFASSHTCLPAMGCFPTARGQGVIANNGAAGMPNFRNRLFGLLTRIGIEPSPRALYGTRLHGVHVEALPIRYAEDDWTRAFLATWPPESSAHASYFRRIADGPDYDIDRATRFLARNPDPRAATQRTTPPGTLPND